MKNNKGRPGKICPKCHVGFMVGFLRPVSRSTTEHGNKCNKCGYEQNVWQKDNN